MDPLTLALLAGAGKQILGGVIGGVNQWQAAQDLKLTPQQKARLLELERMQAANALGMTDAQREQYRSMALSPVQTAEREAMARFGASQQIGDIGQGAAFRQQQALLDTGKGARAEVSQAVAARDADVAQQQEEQMYRLQEQQRKAKAMEREAILGALGGVVEGGLGAVELGAEAQMEKDEFQKTLDSFNDAGKSVAQSTRKMFGITPEMKKVEGLNKPTLGVDGVSAVEGMIPYEKYVQDLLSMYTNPYDTLQGKDKDWMEQLLLLGRY